MTSVGVIWSAAARIKRLKDLHKDPESWPFEADGILEDLKQIKKSLEAVSDPRTEAGAEREIKEVVRLSYEIVDVIADSFKPSSILDPWKKSGTTKLRELQAKLQVSLKEQKRKINHQPSSPPGEKNTGTEISNSSKNSQRMLINFLSNSLKPSIKKKPEAESTTVSKTPVENTQQKTESISGSNIQVHKQASGSENREEMNRTVLMNQLRSDLKTKPSERNPREVCIVGKSGMGKSTLVRELYNDPEIRKLFRVFGWVPIKHNFQIKRVLQLLLQQLGGPQHEQQLDLGEMNEIELISEIFRVVKNKPYLLVLDGIGGVKDWESIRLALPFSDSAKVIITTSSDEFEFLKMPHHYRIPDLTLSETLALLKKEASFSEDSEVGKVIYEISGGLPLYATILGKSLESKADDPHLIDELKSYKPKRGEPQVLNASYRRLPHELKPCFLYLGLFPPAQPMQVDKLYLLLEAENLIMSPEESGKSSDQYLREYLGKLAGLKFVEVEEDELSKTGLYKYCRIHDLVRDFCISKALDEEFLEVVDFKLVDSKQDVLSDTHTRRLAVYMRNYKGEKSISLKGNSGLKRILSLLIFDAFESAEEESGWPSELNDLEDFSRLRVLSFDEVNFKDRKPPKGLEKLLLLRYLSFRGCFLEELPSSLSKLTQLETLDLLVRDNCCVTIPDNIFTNMKRMVHLFLPRLYKGNGKKKLSLQGLEMLETLINFDTEIFEEGDLAQLEKIKILSTISNGENSEEMDAVINLLNKRASQLQHSSVEIRSFDGYDDACSSALKKLLQCGFVDSVRIEGEIWELPAEGGVGERVAEMVLHGSEREDDLMGYLAKFQNLRSLVLADDAFMGTDIIFSSSSAMFPKLRSLKLRNLQYLEKLTIKEEEALPELSSLQIESCGDALDLTIPEGLYHRLKNVTGGGAYSVVPPPSKFITTP